MHEFLHGINHIGWHGIAPLLVLGCQITEKDFVVRDLSWVQGVVIRQCGLEKGLVWNELGLELIALKLPNLKLIDIEYESRCDVSAFGPQPFLTHLNLICPKLKQKSDIKQFANAKQVELKIPDEFLNHLISQHTESLVISSPKFESLKALDLRQNLKKLVVQYARNIKTLSGIENFPNLLEGYFTDCPNLLEVGDSFDNSCIQKILLSGVRRLISIEGLVNARFLAEAKVILASKNLVIPEAIRSRVKTKEG